MKVYENELKVVYTVISISVPKLAELDVCLGVGGGELAALCLGGGEALTPSFVFSWLSLVCGW